MVARVPTTAPRAARTSRASTANTPNEAAEQPALETLSAAEAAAHPISGILLDQKTIAGIRFSVGKDFWAGYEFHGGLPDHVYGTFTRWADTKALKVSIKWDDDSVIMS